MQGKVFPFFSPSQVATIYIDDTDDWLVNKAATLLQRDKTCGQIYCDHTPVTVTGTIQPNFYLRPKPQSQLDGMEMTADEKKAYQNPGY